MRATRNQTRTGFHGAKADTIGVIAAALAVLLLLGCDPGVAQVLVYVAVEGPRSDDVEAVRFEVVDVEDSVRWACLRPADRDECPIGEVATAPEPGFLARLPIASAVEPDAAFTVRVSLFSRGEPTPFAEQTVFSRLTPAQTRQIVVVFGETACDEACPVGFRCVEGSCVEHCVDGTPFLESDPNLVSSVPVACADPCTEGRLSCGRPCRGATCPSPEESSALPALALVCGDDGVQRIDPMTRCSFGCDGQRCGHLAPSHGLVARHPAEALVDLDLSGDAPCGEVVYRFEADGSISRPGEVIRPEGEGDSGVKSGIGFSVQTSPEGESFLVYEVRSLTLRCARLEFQRSDARYALLVHRTATFDGVVDVPNAFEDATPPNQPGAAGSGSSGGGGGSFGTQGAAGGRGRDGSPGQPGARVDPMALRFQFGAAGGDGTGELATGGGAGGGALQVSAEHIIVTGQIEVTGGSPTSATRFATFDAGSGGGGGGSGGSVLLEAATVTLSCEDACVDTSGGRGGRRDRAIPQAFGSAGETRDADPGQDDPDGAGGGGGGAGFVLVRVLEPSEAMERSVRETALGAVRVERVEGPFAPWGLE